jgi:hypothetical protein
MISLERLAFEAAAGIGDRLKAVTHAASIVTESALDRRWCVIIARSHGELEALSGTCGAAESVV